MERCACRAYFQWRRHLPAIVHTTSYDPPSARQRPIVLFSLQAKSATVHRPEFDMLHPAWGCSQYVPSGSRPALATCPARG